MGRRTSLETLLRFVRRARDFLEGRRRLESVMTECVRYKCDLGNTNRRLLEIESKIRAPHCVQFINNATDIVLKEPQWL